MLRHPGGIEKSAAQRNEEEYHGTSDALPTYATRNPPRGQHAKEPPQQMHIRQLSLLLQEPYTGHEQEGEGNHGV
jgi:hypothetical protein